MWTRGVFVLVCVCVSVDLTACRAQFISRALTTIAGDELHPRDALLYVLRRTADALLTHCCDALLRHALEGGEQHAVRLLAIRGAPLRGGDKFEKSN